MKNASSLLVSLVIAGALIGLPSCSQKPGPAKAGDSAQGQPRDRAQDPSTQVVTEDKGFGAEGSDKVETSDLGAARAGDVSGRLTDIFFDFDVSSIRPDQQAAVAANAAVLEKSGRLRILIEGHCDERGTKKYNMALGERRAESAKEALTILGIDPARISITSFGSESPFALGHDESAWAQNRRAHLRVLEK